MWTVQGLNLRPSACDADALPSELTVQKLACLGPAARTTDMPCGARHTSGSPMLARALRPTPRGVPTQITWALPAVSGALCNGENRTRSHAHVCASDHTSGATLEVVITLPPAPAAHPPTRGYQPLAGVRSKMTGATRGCGSGPALPNRLGRIVPELLGALP